MSLVLSVSSSGRITVPAEVRRRWNARFLIAEDHGDHLILRPAPHETLARAEGQPGQDSTAETREP